MSDSSSRNFVKTLLSSKWLRNASLYGEARSKRYFQALLDVHNMKLASQTGIRIKDDCTEWVVGLLQYARFLNVGQTAASHGWSPTIPSLVVRNLQNDLLMGRTSPKHFLQAFFGKQRIDIVAPELRQGAVPQVFNRR
ncbi:hypothetical protein HDU85_001634 [Gaertneriomyces sp. JEL0708]|nr:hypothetical protein HDU85_001634 [Gaertneriomyces sp. JEL0708]